MNGLHVLLVALGGALGSVARYGLSLALPAGAGIPWGTLGANVVGCLLIGVFTEWAGSRLGLTPEARLFLTTGFCGGFTTLSTLMLELGTFFRGQDWALATAYLLASLVLPFAALWLGMGLFRLVVRA